MENYRREIKSSGKEFSSLPLFAAAFGYSAFGGAKDDSMMYPGCHRLIYIREGAGIFACQNQSDPVNEGTLIYVRKGIQYRLDNGEDSQPLGIYYIDFKAKTWFVTHLKLPSHFCCRPKTSHHVNNIVRMSGFALDTYHDQLLIASDIYHLLCGAAHDYLISERDALNNTKSRVLPAAVMIEEKYGTEISVQRLAQACGLSENHFSRCFKQVYGASPIQYLTAKRIIKAKDMIIGTDMTMEEIAQCCGFKSERSFSEAFIKHEHMSPLQLRKIYKESVQISFFDK